MPETEVRDQNIWAIGGGKGGTGKSFIISNIANYLALKGNRVILIDADLGGANLHTFLGIKRPNSSLTDFFEKKLPLEDLIIDSGIDNMGLIAGAIRSLAPENIKYTQKLKLFRQIRKLNADYILIDLGAGTHFNTIDAFLLSDRMIVGIVPEIIAIENLYYYLKSAFFRRLLYAMAERGLKDLAMTAWKERKSRGIQNLRQFIDYLKTISIEIERIVDFELESFEVHIILNKVKTGQEITVGNSIKSICKKYFNLNARYAGYIEYDDFVSRCINKRQPYMQAYPASRCTKEIGSITESILTGRQFDSRVIS